MFRPLRFLAVPYLATAALSAPAQAADAPVVLVQQGRLLDASDQPVTSPVELKVTLFASKEEADAGWSDSFQVTPDRFGQYVVTLGSQAPLKTSDLAGRGYLGVSIGSQALLPRLRIGTTAFAVRAADAEMLGGKPATEYALKTDVPATAQDSLKLGGVAAADYALKTDTAPNAQQLGGVAASEYALKTQLSTNAATLNGHSDSDFLLASSAAVDSAKLGGLVAAKFAQLSPSAPQAGDLAITGTVTANKLVVSDRGVVANLNAERVGGLDAASLSTGRSWAKAGAVAANGSLSLTVEGDATNATVFVWERQGNTWAAIDPEFGKLLGDPALQAYYNFEETTGTTANDQSGRGKALTLVDSFTVGQAGKDGNGLKFGGTGGSGGGYATNAALGMQLGTGLTMALWMNPAELNRDIHFFTLHRNGSSHDVYFSIYPPNCGAAKLSLRGDVTGSQCSKADIALNAWTHVAATYDQVTQTVRIYVNGALDNVVPAQALAINGLSMNFLRLGARFSGHGYDYIGRFDDAVVLNRILEPSEIAALAAHNPGTGNYRLDKGSDGTVRLTNLSGGTRDVRLLVVK